MLAGPTLLGPMLLGSMLLGPMLLAGCGGPPRVMLTSADPHSIEFFVQNARFMPPQDVEDRALRHCADYGLVSRRTQAEWINDWSMTFRFECDDPHKPPLETLADRKTAEPRVAPHKASAVRSPADRKQAAWNQANAMSPLWAKCILDEATRMGRSSNERSDIAATSVAASCSHWERDIHEVLRKAGEQDVEFQADLHKQVIEFATSKIVSVRESVPVAASE
jgi:hypothetical protein